MKLYLSIALSIRPFVSPSLCIFRLFRIPPSASSDEPSLGFKLKDRLPDLSVPERTQAPSGLISLLAATISCLVHRPLLLSARFFVMKSILFDPR